MEIERFNHLNSYLKRKFGERVLKICVDAGFTCPNRDGSKSFGGCLFCSARGSGDHLYKTLSIKDQILNYLASYKKDRANKFIVFFQAFSNTYASLDKLQELYLEAISTSDKIVGLEIATRPDCITKEICELLQKFKSKVDVVVELGLQTANAQTAELLNLKYSPSDFSKAVNLLHSYDIETVAHIMVGLPNETHNNIESTVDFINSSNISGVKIHSTYVLKNTGLETLYNTSKFTPLTQDEYLNELCFILTHLRPDIIIHRFTGDPPAHLLVAPLWTLHKKPILNGIEKLLKANNLIQGIYYNKK